jgi:hypothetical protein
MDHQSDVLFIGFAICPEATSGELSTSDEMYDIITSRHFDMPSNPHLQHLRAILALAVEYKAVRQHHNTFTSRIFVSQVNLLSSDDERLAHLLADGYGSEDELLTFAALNIPADVEADILAADRLPETRTPPQSLTPSSVSSITSSTSSSPASTLPSNHFCWYRPVPPLSANTMSLNVRHSPHPTRSPAEMCYSGPPPPYHLVVQAQGTPQAGSLSTRDSGRD